MLGYVRIDSQELRLREYECYRALYCGLCKSMGKCTGQCSRMTLSYDFVFLAAVRIALSKETLTVKKKRCPLHWIRKRKAVMNSPTLTYCADASALLSYQKLLDDCKDESGLKKLRALLARPFLVSAYRKAKKRHPELDAQIAEQLSALSAFEAEPNDSIELPASYFGALMRAVFAEGLEGTDARLAGNIGDAVGRWIYLLDAANDLEEDCKKGRFNPYAAQFGNSLEQSEKELVQHALVAHLSDAEKAFLLIDPPAHPEIQEILANILYLGLPKAAQSALFPTCKKKRRTKQTDSER